MVTIVVQGGSFDLHESEKFNKVRHRLNRAKQLVEDYRNGDNRFDGEDGEKFEPFHLLSFRVETDEEDGGRIAVDPERIIAVISDEPKDQIGDDEE